MTFPIRLFLLLVTPVAVAQEIYVPEVLRDWAPWVTEGREYRDCPFLFDRPAAGEEDYVCAWPGELELTVEEGGASFTLPWTVYGDAEWLLLPGDAVLWPEAVTAGGGPVTVVARGGLPAVRLGPGSHVLSGRILWDERPGLLRIPDAVGLVELSVDGRAVPRPERTRGGLFLGAREPVTEIRDSATLEVFRLVRDDVPTRLVTRLRVEVAGRVREETFGPVLPEGFVPLTMESPLPARLEADGMLRLQVRPGSWNLQLVARGSGVVETLAPPEPALAATEIWSYQANDALRVTVPEGAPPVDPRQADVPADWLALPAFRLEPGISLTIAERSRGIVSAGNELVLSRQVWLDFAGGGFTVSDAVGGTMRTDWRLDMARPYALASAEVDGENLLVTEGPGEGQTGVELRREEVSLAALGRAETRDRLPVTGWDKRFAHVSAILNLPPGHRLLAAPGVDAADGSWLSEWRLLDFFLLLVVTIAAWRLFGRGAGLLAFAALALSFHEAGAPTWAWLNLLIAIALTRVAPAGRLRQAALGYQGVSALLLVVALVPFLVGQIKIAIYPQLERPYGAVAAPGVAGPELVMREQAHTRSSPVLAESARPSSLASEEPKRAEFADDARAPAAGESYARYAPNAIVQAGPGKPAWRWNTYRLDWGGPVTAGQTMRLVILPRWAVTSLRFVIVALLAALAAVLAAEMLGRKLPLPGRGAGTGGTGLVLAGIALLAGPPHAAAQVPDPELLRELEARLTAPPDCAPRCAELVAADVAATAGALRMRLAAHALAEVALPLPGSESGWRPTAIRVGTAPAARVLRGPDQALWIRLPEGRHTIELAGPLGSADSVEIPFPTPPRAVTVSADGWLVTGVRNRRLVSGALTLTRRQAEADAASGVAWESSRFPAFAEITRTIRLDLDWSVTTQVRRIAPAEGALSLSVPLLDGEAVLTDGVTVRDGRVEVSMAPRQSVFTWTGTLARAPALGLVAPAEGAWREVWQVGVGRTWHAEFDGVPESSSAGLAREARIARFYPRPGERLAIDVTRPPAAGGGTLAFDNVIVTVDAGRRARATELTLAYRSTRGRQHVLRLPADATVTEVTIDGRIEPLRAEAGELTLPILPGQHSVGIRLRQDATLGITTRTPAIDLGAPSSNLNLRLSLPDSRWLLGTQGPPLGPAVLYWPELAALVLLALVLGRVDFTPLRTHHWLLLGLGFSTFSWPVLALVAAWLLALGARDRWPAPGDDNVFNAVQVLIGALTVVALLAIVVSLPQGLLGSPDMHVTGNQSGPGRLNWFADRSAAALPVATAWSGPLWTYKVLILTWALWLSFALLAWLPWAWRVFTKDGYWRPMPAAD